MSKAKLMLGNAVEISLISHGILGPLVLDKAPNHFLGAQLACGKKKGLVGIPGSSLTRLYTVCHSTIVFYSAHLVVK